MFDPGIAELFLIGIIALVVLGPERLPVVARKLGRFVGKLQRMFVGFQHEVQRHVDVIETPVKQMNSEIQTELDSVEKSMQDVSELVESDETGSA